MSAPPSEGPLLGAVEGGGTKFVCAVGRGPDDIVEQVRFETRGPDETLGRAIEFLRPHAPSKIGVAMFGPLELSPDAGEGYGAMLGTPKPGWAGAPVRARLAAALGAPVAIDTDVNAAALGEQRWGAARGADPVVYVTVGTGVGGGVVVHGRPVHGLMHPELGHLPMPRLADASGAPDPFEGACPFHGRCLEGLASGTALAARLGDPSATPASDPVWELVAGYVAHGLAAAVLLLSPERIVIGGGVMERQPHLLPRVRRRLREVLAGYVARPELDEGLDAYVVPPRFEHAGLAGAFALVE